MKQFYPHSHKYRYTHCIYRSGFANEKCFFFFLPHSIAASGVGFILVIDRRQDRWAAVRATLHRIAVSVVLGMFVRALKSFY